MPHILDLSAKRGKGEDQITTNYKYDVGENIHEAIELFGEKEVHAVFVKGLRVATQAAAANFHASGHSEEEVQEYMNSWKPGMKTERVVKVVDPVNELMKQWTDGTLSEERKAEIFAEISKTMPAANRRNR